jgi:PRTRC genetic system protein A
MNNQVFVHHIFATGETLPPFGPYLYEYVIGANGVFVRARRAGLEALIWVASTRETIRGLAEVEPFVRLAHPLPARMLCRLVEMAYRSGNREILFYLQANPWRIAVPDQIRTGGSVTPVDPFAGGADTLLEVHSHHSMVAFFSRIDDRDEQAGFRLFAVLGDLYRRPTLLVRVGIYGHFWTIPASWIAELPEGLNDGSQLAAPGLELASKSQEMDFHENLD